MHLLSPIRVAFCIDNMNVGGTELNAVRTAERLDRDRFDLRVISLQAGGPLMDRYREAGIVVRPTPIRNFYGPGALATGFAMARWLRRERVEILHAHDIYSNVFGGGWGRVAGVRTVASRRWWEGFREPHWRAASAGAYRLADAVLANSEAVGALLREEGVPAGKVAVVPNFLDEAAFDAPPEYRVRELRAEMGILPTDRVVGIVANLLPVKDHATLLRAFAPLAECRSDVRLVLVGDGGERGALEALAAALGVAGRVVFAGRRPNHPNLHHLFDVSVLCSSSEGLPNSVLEAMAAGRPVVASDVGAVSDAVVDGVTGLLFPAGDSGRLKSALGTLLADGPRARGMGEAGRIRAMERYSPSGALRKLEALYERLAGRPAHLSPDAPWLPDSRPVSPV